MPPPADAASNPIDPARVAAAVQAERVALYRAGKWSAVLGQALVAGLVLWVVQGQVGAERSGWWAAGLGATLLLRLTVGFSIGAAPAAAVPAATLRAELWRARSTVLAMGLGWALCSLLLFPPQDIQAQTFLAFMMAGLAAGALTLTAFDLRTALAFAAVTLAPLVLQLLNTEFAAAKATGVAAALFVLYLALSGARAQRNMLAAVATRAAEADRAERLLESQRQLQQTTAELRRASDELRVTFDQMEQGILAYDADGRVRFFNRRLCELTGLDEALLQRHPTVGELMRTQVELGHFGKNLELLDPVQREHVRGWIAGRPLALPPHLTRRTHLGRVLDIKSAPLPDGGAVRTFSDVTAMYEANQRLQASEAQSRKLALVASHTDNAVIITDPERRIEWVNEGFTRITGYTPAEAIGRTTAEMLRGPETDSETVRRLDEDLLQRQKSAGEVRLVRKNGQPFWFAAESHAILDERGRVERYVGIGRDVTAARTAEAALRAAHDEAERASRAKSEFLSAMSHELRTPMNAILGFAQLLEEGTQPPLAPRQREQVGLIRDAGAHLLALINDVLDLARVEAGRQEIELAAVAVAPLLEECEVLMRPLAEDRAVRLLPTAGLGNALQLRADRVRLKQVLLNLLANAIKYNQPTGQVRIEVQANPAEVTIAVIDTGPGLGDEAQAKLFTAFERLGAERGPVEGAGIGLALSRRLVQLMHGRIEVQSRPGHGSTFSVTLPRADAAADPAAAEPAAPRGEAAEALRGTVLYIEDNAVNVLLVQAMLEADRGLRFLSAEHPELGLELARRERPDLVLLDIQLPGIDGYEVLRRLRADESTRRTPVIAISANAMRGDVDRGLSAGFDGYLTKPLDIRVLRAAVREKLATR